MEIYTHTQTGVDIEQGETEALAAAIRTCQPDGWRYDGYTSLSHGISSAHHRWTATYTNGKTGRSRRAKQILVLMGVPAN